MLLWVGNLGMGGTPVGGVVTSAGYVVQYRDLRRR